MYKFMSQELYFEGKYLENNPTWHIEDSKWKAQKIIKMIETNNLQPNLVAEIGCGAGGILDNLHSKMSKNVIFHGFDISPQAWDLCQQMKKDRLQFHLIDLLETENIFFDIVLCIDVFEHIEDYFIFLRKLKSKAKYKIFHIPLDLSVSSVLRSSPILYARQKVGHIHYFTKETALAALKDTGYEIIDLFYTGSSLELPTKSLKTLLARVPRKIMSTFNLDLTVRLMGGYSIMVLAR